MKIHISLVGGQTAPVHLGIKITNPDKVFLIHSEETKNEAERLKNEIKIECELIMFHPVDLKQINESINKFLSKIDFNNEISINLVGGTKPWSIVFFNYCQKIDNIKLFYVDQNNNVWDFKTNSSEEVDFSLDTHFRLYGNRINKFKKLSDFTEEDIDNITKIKDIRKHNFKDFNEAIQHYSKHTNNNEVKLKSGSILTWEPEKRQFIFKIIKKKLFKVETLNYILKSENIRSLIINSGWFELEVALMMKEWSKTKEIRLNCIFNTKTGSPKNEIDIIINTGIKVLFIECKTQIKNETDIDKFSSAVKNYGGYGSKAIFITEEKLNQKSVEKCNDNGILHFSFKDYDNKETAIKKLYELLDKNLYTINPK